AMISQQLGQAARLDPFAAYLAGLVHDMGTITLVNLISREAKDANARVSPHATVGVVDSMAKELTSLIAADWGLPASVSEALADQRRNEPRSALGRLLQEAHFLSETYLLNHLGLIERDEAEQVRMSVGAPAQLFSRLDDQVEADCAA
ncbi:MAG: HDOD domain-containing protein, partial [Pseudomonadota bacterium]